MRYSFRHTLLSILILLLSGQTYCQSLSDISFGTDSTFEVVTWNIEWFPKNGSITVDSVSKIIESLDVDLLGLQEIDDTTICRQMINNLSDYELFMDSNWFGGLAYVYKSSSIRINSIYKIYDTSPFWNAFPRSPLVMDLTYMGKDIIVINNHFKCCGDGLLDIGNSSDEEARRHEASSLLKQYIDINFPSSRVIVLGDLNDILTDGSANNVFQMFLDDSANYLFADEAIANSSSTDWSFPGWPSHLDHILITNELFSEVSNSGSEVKTIRIDDFMAGGLANYDNNISDHRPVGLKIKFNPTNVSLVEVLKSNIKIFPNPTNGSINVYSEETMSTINLRLTNALGQVISTKNYKSTNHINFDLDAPKGVYFLQIDIDHQVVTKKIFKN
jgi:endonuclease/exonuclease/phosphatase family metal-dependent hydrolase